VRGTSPSTDTVTSDLLAPRDSDRSALLFVGLRGDFRPCCCGQAVRLANQVGELSDLGAEVVLASFDPPDAQLGSS